MRRFEWLLSVVTVVVCCGSLEAGIPNFRIASDVQLGGYFGFHGDNVSYTGSDGYGKIKNLTSGLTYDVTPHANTMIDISPSYVTYMDSVGDGDIWAAQINGDGSLASSLFQLAGPGDQWWPMISDNKVVWMDKRHGQWEIYSAALVGNSVSQTERLTYDGNHDIYPCIYGDNVVWQRRDAANQTIGLFGMNVATGEDFTIFEGNAFGSGIYGDRVAYNAHSLDTGTMDIYVYDIVTKTSTRIASGSSVQTYPDIYEDTVVWQDNRNGNWDIFAYNLTTGQETQLTDNPLDQIQPLIFGDMVVWQDYRDGGSIYGVGIRAVPVPSALILGSLGLGYAGWRVRRLKHGRSDTES